MNEVTKIATKSLDNPVVAELGDLRSEITSRAPQHSVSFTLLRRVLVHRRGAYACPIHHLMHVRPS